MVSYSYRYVLCFALSNWSFIRTCRISIFLLVQPLDQSARPLQVLMKELVGGPWLTALPWMHRKYTRCKIWVVCHCECMYVYIYCECMYTFIHCEWMYAKWCKYLYGDNVSHSYRYVLCVALSDWSFTRTCRISIFWIVQPLDRSALPPICNISSDSQCWHDITIIDCFVNARKRIQ